MISGNTPVLDIPPITFDLSPDQSSKLKDLTQGQQFTDVLKKIPLLAWLAIAGGSYYLITRKDRR